MSNYRLSRQADRDLDGIADYIADFNPTANYVIFYYPRADGIEVISVIHGAQDWTAMFPSR